MTYWAKDHAHNLRRLADITRELDGIYEDLIPGLIRDLADDDRNATADSRRLLREARSHIASAMNLIGAAEQQLPTPQQPTVREA